MTDDKTTDDAAVEQTEEAPVEEVKEEAPKEEPKKEEPKEEKKKADVALSKDAQKVLDMVKKMSLMEVADLVKAMEDEFGVSAAAPMAMAAAPAAGGEVAEEKDSYDVELTSAGSQKIAAIKAVKELSGLGLKEAKDIVDAAPKVFMEGVKTADAEEAKKKIEAAGATCTLK
ncbi:50S ribosomal protein L7/L12 [Patescibacteria group bacterium]|nr:50S ribosomal protein L7/L12 [Patescibacteria group bacterium]MBU1019329.1 50S ribosomal protein L7/L12 [Patescibacteria group bacterium]